MSILASANIETHSHLERETNMKRKYDQNQKEMDKLPEHVKLLQDAVQTGKLPAHDYWNVLGYFHLWEDNATYRQACAMLKERLNSGKPIKC